jgi:hypothetical protein
MLFECKAFEEERAAFLARLYSVCPLARQLTDEYRCRLVVGDKLPREIEAPVGHPDRAGRRLLGACSFF